MCAVVPLSYLHQLSPHAVLVSQKSLKGWVWSGSYNDGVLHTPATLWACQSLRQKAGPPLSSYSLSFSFCHSNSCLLVDASMRRGSKQINGLDPHDVYCRIRAGDRMFIDLSKLQSRRMNIHSVRFSHKAPFCSHRTHCLNHR